jgi:hypothetical protein
MQIEEAGISFISSINKYYYYQFFYEKFSD